MYLVRLWGTSRHVRFFVHAPSGSMWTEKRQRPVTGFGGALPTKASVVVIGAGVSGLVTAAMLDDHGVDVVVVDAESGPRA